MSEILIQHPTLNKTSEIYRRYSHLSNMLRESMALRVRDGNITPITHPRVVDLYAGDGSMARIMADLGWDERNILCIDSHISPDPLVTDATWVYMDLDLLASQITDQSVLPPEIAKYHKQFDVSLSQYGNPDPFLKARILRDWFAREGAYVV